MSEEVILVDHTDQVLGFGEKWLIHRKGILHRSFSILIYNSRGQMLLQQRAAGKYHSGGLWSNACCGHPRPGEETIAAGERRLKEEMGFECPLTPAFTFLYRLKVGELTEHEFGHVLIGSWDGLPNPNPQETQGWRWAPLELLRLDLDTTPDAYTPWFHLIMKRV